MVREKIQIQDDLRQEMKKARQGETRQDKAKIFLKIS